MIAADKNEEVNMKYLMNYTAGKYYRIRLDDPVCLDYASDSFCRMLGYTREEIGLFFDGRYTAMIHPDDIEKYDDFIAAVRKAECSLMIQYRLVAKNGDIICVSDTMTSRKYSDGKLWAFSAVTDITDMESGGQRTGVCRDIVVYGVMRLTYEKYPSVISMNEGMERLIGLNEKSADSLEDVKENIYFLLPFECRQKFRKCLEEADRNGKNVDFKVDIFKCDGTRIPVAGWLCKVSVAGHQEYQCILFDAEMYFTEERNSLKSDFLNVMINVFDSVFEVETINRTVRCISTNDPDVRRSVMNVRMLVEDTVKYWIDKIYPPEDKGKFEKLLESIYDENSRKEIPHTIEFGIKHRPDRIRYYSGTYFMLNNIIGVFCCLDITCRRKESGEDLQQHNVLEFILSGDKVQPVNVNAETRRFLGMNREEMGNAANSTGGGVYYREFFRHCPISGEDVLELINKGNKDYMLCYSDGRKEMRTADLVASERCSDAFSVKYTVLYNIIPANRTGSGAVEPLYSKRSSNIYIRTFGYFDVFVDDQPIAFKSAKAKELLAVLVDRKGGYVSSGEAISYLWEDETANKVTLSRYRKVAMKLKNELKANGIGDIITVTGGKRCINRNMVRCDLYDYLEDKEKNRSMFTGSYLLNYSWSEFTLAELQEM